MADHVEQKKTNKFKLSIFFEEKKDKHSNNQKVYSVGINSKEAKTIDSFKKEINVNTHIA